MINYNKYNNKTNIIVKCKNVKKLNVILKYSEAALTYMYSPFAINAKYRL